MLPRLFLFVLGGIVLLSCGTTQRIPRVKRHNLKVRINATGDTITFKFVRPSPDTKLEGYILGYGSSMFSKQFIQLPEDGVPYETEVDAEPKYLIAVQPIPANDVKKQCTGQVNLEKPLHLVIGSVTPTSVLLSWGMFLKMPYEGSIMNDCLEDGHYTVRYRPKHHNKKWTYQTCPTRDTVIDRLRPNTPYEFGVRPSKNKQDGVWSRPVVYSTNGKDGPRKPNGPMKPNGHMKPNGPMMNPRKEEKPQTDKLLKPVIPSVKDPVPPKIMVHDKTQPPVFPHTNHPGSPSTTRRPLASHRKQPDTPTDPSSKLLHRTQGTLGIANSFTKAPSSSADVPDTTTQFIPSKTLTTSATPVVIPSVNDEKHQGQAQPRADTPTTRPQISSTKTTERHQISLAKGETYQGHFVSKPSIATLRPNVIWDKRNPFRNFTTPTANPSGPSIHQPYRKPSMRTFFNSSNGLTRPGHVPPRPINIAQATENRRHVNGEQHKGTVRPKWQQSSIANNSLLEDIAPAIPDHYEWSESTLGNNFSGDRSSNPGSGSHPGSFGNGSVKPGTVPKPHQTVIPRQGSSSQITTNTVVDKTGKKDSRKPNDKILKVVIPSVTPKPNKQERRQTTTTSPPTMNASRFDIGVNSSVFSSVPLSDVDAMGQRRFTAPHVVYKVDKKPDEPCSITNSLSHFPEEEVSDQNATAAPKNPPTNLTVVTVEGCPSFIILDWEKPDNDTSTEYQVTTKQINSSGVQDESVLTTNQTHSAVENLQPNSSYEFTVQAKNEFGTGPPSDPVTFSTESADPRVSENLSGKDAIWTEFPFKPDAYSECNGKQYVKRTWYRKFVGVQLCNSLRYKIYLSDSLKGKFYNIGDQTGHGEDHCQFVDSFLDGRTGHQLTGNQLPPREGYYRAVRQEPVNFGQIGGNSHITYVPWYECGTTIPGKW